MLIEYCVGNHGSIRDQACLSMVASNYYREHPSHLVDVRLPGLKDVKLLKAAALFGANASGKTTVIRSIAALVSLVSGSASAKPGDLMPFNPFMLDLDSRYRPTTYEIVFVSDGVRYSYHLAHDAVRVVSESLSSFPKGRERKLFDRIWVPERESYEWIKSSSIRISRDLFSMTRQNVLFLSLAAQLNHPELTAVFTWFTNSLRVLSFGPDSESFPYDFSAEQIREESPLRDGILEMVKHADVGIDGIHVVDLDPGSVEGALQALRPVLDEAIYRNLVDGTEKVRSVEFEHAGSEGGQRLNYGQESGGTQRLFSIAGPWLDTIQSDYTLIVDELDAHLHPLLVTQMIDMLYRDSDSDHSAQVVFSTHSPFLLASDTLRRDQVWVTEKDRRGSTDLVPLSDFRPRKDESLFLGYLAGRYGGIPLATL